ncbi:MAG: hypothetical protein COA79_12165 [Planctomycetota bacterium]|nr:MAG: hypothetical protein COA79_12165 [Planctomycetota bacterium]
MPEEIKYQNISSQGDIAVQGALKLGLNVLKAMMLLLVGLWLFSGVYKVEKGEAAVTYYMGKIQPYKGQNVRYEGLYWGLPEPFTKKIIEKVNQAVNIEIDLFDVEDTTNGNINEDPIVKHERPFNVTKDMNLIHLSWNITYKIKKFDLFILNFYEEGDMNKGHGKDKPWRLHALKLIDSVARGIIVSECSQYNAIDILTSKVNFNQSVMERLQLQLDNLKTGIEIIQLKLIKAKPPVSLEISFKGVSQVRIKINQTLTQSRTFSNKMIIQTESIVNKILVDEDNNIREMRKNVETEALKLKELLKSFKGDPKVRKNYMEQIYLKTIANILYNSKVEFISNQKRLRYKTTIFSEDTKKDE